MKPNRPSSDFRVVLFLAGFSFALAYLIVGATTYLPGHEPSFLFSILLSIVLGLYILLAILLPYYLYKYCCLFLKFLKRAGKGK